MRVFIIRPFNVQENIDFEKVDSDLIQQALKRLREMGVDVAGGTTGDISAAGNIRVDMFRLIAVSDLVIADVTIHNANAFYELGIRHALCPRATVMIREKNTPVKYPFDLQTDRYFRYDYNNLAQGVDALATTIKSTLTRSEHDSPIFTLLPALQPHGRGKLVKVPQSFVDDVAAARRTDSRGDLRLLAYECAAFEWDQEGLQLVGDAQLKLRAYVGARDTFEMLRKSDSRHYDANWRLGTIYQRMASASQGVRKAKYEALSDDAITCALEVAVAAKNPADQAEQHSLRGSNAKNHWMAEYRAAPADKRAQRALESPNLTNMLEHYMRAAACDLNAHYPAVNVLAFLRTQTLLAYANREVWDGMHDDGAKELAVREELIRSVSATLRLALRLDVEFEKYQSAADGWASSSIAEFTLLCTPDKTAKIRQRYLEANSTADWFTLEANKRNLLIFKEFGLLEPGVSAALAAIDQAMATRLPPSNPPKRVVLFTGHMVDRPGRSADKARFPPTSKAEATARQLIRDALVTEVGTDSANTLGIAGGACGGDILFHEVCAELGIKTELYLLLPQNMFQVESVNHGNADWVQRYQKLCANKKDSIRQLQEDKPLPKWLNDRKDYSIWERNNLWMMFNALAVGAENATLMALFNVERDPDGPGGTKHLVELAKEHEFKSLTLDARVLLS